MAKILACLMLAAALTGTILVGVAAFDQDSIPLWILDFFCAFTYSMGAYPTLYWKRD
jgi:hypothetical protein